MKFLLLTFLLSTGVYANNKVGFAFLYKVSNVPPTVTNISPASGTTLGGTGLTLTGTQFSTGATVTVGGVTCTSPNVLSPTSLTCTTGARAAGTVSATVTNPSTLSGTGGSYTYVTPVVANIRCFNENGTGGVGPGGCAPISNVRSSLTGIWDGLFVPFNYNVAFTLNCPTLPNSSVATPTTLFFVGSDQSYTYDGGQGTIYRHVISSINQNVFYRGASQGGPKIVYNATGGVDVTISSCTIVP